LFLEVATTSAGLTTVKTNNVLLGSGSSGNGGFTSGGIIIGGASFQGYISWIGIRTNTPTSQNDTDTYNFATNRFH
jgi:hypothetical protein